MLYGSLSISRLDERKTVLRCNVLSDLQRRRFVSPYRALQVFLYSPESVSDPVDAGRRRCRGHHVRECRSLGYSCEFPAKLWEMGRG